MLLKVQSCKLYNNKYMIASTHIAQKMQFSIKGFFSKCDQFGHIYWRNYQWKISFFVQWQIRNTEIFGFTAVLVFKLLSPKSFAHKHKWREKLLKSKLLFKKIANFTAKLMENYK